ncbi:MAG: deoxyribonuclease IV [Mycoplasmoidaceae bacterium]
MDKLLIGSHVAFKAKDYLVGSIKESLSYGSNCMMIYTGAPQNFIRKPIDLVNTNQGHLMLKENGIAPEHVIVHAPYIINLASSNPKTREASKDFLVEELKRVATLGLKYLVLHPGSCLEQTKEKGIELIIKGINEAFKRINNDVWILLETMAGKGSEIGTTFLELSEIIKGVKKPQVGICLDTCHMHEAGMDLKNVDQILNEFATLIDFNLIKAIHLNDSKNEIGARKDRHENIGYGKIGFKTLYQWYSNERLKSVPKILETPYFLSNDKSVPPYQQEIAILRKNQWSDFKK